MLSKMNLGLMVFTKRNNLLNKVNDGEYRVNFDGHGHIGFLVRLNMMN